MVIAPKLQQRVRYPLVIITKFATIHKPGFAMKGALRELNL